MLFYIEVNQGKENGKTQELAWRRKKTSSEEKRTSRKTKK